MDYDLSEREAGAVWQALSIRLTDRPASLSRILKTNHQTTSTPAHDKNRGFLIAI